MDSHILNDIVLDPIEGAEQRNRRKNDQDNPSPKVDASQIGPGLFSLPTPTQQRRAALVRLLVRQLIVHHRILVRDYDVGRGEPLLLVAGPLWPRLHLQAIQPLATARARRNGRHAHQVLDVRLAHLVHV